MPLHFSCAHYQEARFQALLLLLCACCFIFLYAISVRFSSKYRVVGQKRVRIYPLTQVSVLLLLFGTKPSGLRRALGAEKFLRIAKTLMQWHVRAFMCAKLSSDGALGSLCMMCSILWREMVSVYGFMWRGMGCVYDFGILRRNIGLRWRATASVYDET